MCYGATLDVPLVIAGPGIDVTDDDALRSLADVAPTLRRLCGLERGGGIDLFADAEDRIVVSESLYANRLYGWAQQAAATDGSFSLVHGGPRLELFGDPAETHPLNDPESHEAYERLDRALSGYKAIVPGESGGSALSPAASPYGPERRSGRVYLPPAENRRLNDARTRLAATLRAVSSLDAATARRDEALVRRFLPEVERLQAKDPTNPALPFARGRAQMFVLKQPAAAARLLRRAVELGYDSPAALSLLKATYVAAGDDAGRAFVEALEKRKNRPR